MPHILNENTAKTQIFEQVQLHLAQMPDYERRDLTEIEKIADPIITKMTHFHSKFSSKFDNTVEWSFYLIFATVFFVFFSSSSFRYVLFAHLSKGR